MWQRFVGGGLVTFQPVPALRTADERRWNLDPSGDAMTGRDDGDRVGAHDPAEVSSRDAFGEVDVGPVARSVLPAK